MDDISNTNSVAGYVVEFGDERNGASSYTGQSTATTTVITAHAPGAPANVAVAAATAAGGQATVSWSTPGDDGGSPITGYLVTATGSNGAPTQTCATTTAVTCTITGLTDAALYTFNVAATNAIGATASSATSELVEATTPTTTPTSPTTPVTVTGPACPAASGSLAGPRLGPVALGMTSAQLHRTLPTYTLTHNGFDRSCLTSAERFESATTPPAANNTQCQSAANVRADVPAGTLGLVRRMLLPLPADRRLRRFVQLSLDLLLYGATAAMLVLSRLGLDPWDVLHQGLSRTFGLAIGTWAILISFLVLLGWWPLRARPGIGTVANAIVVGAVIDLVLSLAGPPHALSARYALLVGGVLGSGFATGLYIGAGLGPGARDIPSTNPADTAAEERQKHCSPSQAVRAVQADPRRAAGHTGEGSVGD